MLHVVRRVPFAARCFMRVVFCLVFGVWRLLCGVVCVCLLGFVSCSFVVCLV